MEHIAFIGIGSNMGSPEEHCKEAADLLDDHPAISITTRSSLYRTEPFGKTEQDWFINSVVEATTHLSAEGLLKACLAIENRMGRARGEKWDPRIIDLDLLFFDDCVFKERGLEIPHPGIPERSFVLVPMNEIAPDFVHPKLKKTIAALLEEIPKPQEVHRLDS
ncbi:MAG: 2-amino-4-hydroxy-6-hydroxymethyldihydropteridine diphosphokinase [Nitrospinaceae bacterium]|nr:2-amino-4-hydroxy-6-hydroxymethyldihydropteridine diphosphokinase [Nitrospinaceae bacterium]NIR55828.1 2-amino-4-hydroxy-6-hydroxymethyldihydropteridine diphosphokinase [Nitrospinaceae bacterium]NIS86281.1 2-amino-4-hydroxy-6-hydroxymethyldihydropteridine diphosphokinase [Nitrospinaceae bacterium]NIT83110.1 2-amino-4-hydroxy-6-hydroxymethyldihydropteridine diphosphokinase [Nitrospinaceae bacterium]NIU45320.1 2-amino-4-hydroxy-6-hydroxymethyldihydropteridine diphosphokinase [Nitrospinaceae ba